MTVKAIGGSVGITGDTLCMIYLSSGRGGDKVHVTIFPLEASVCSRRLPRGVAGQKRARRSNRTFPLEAVDWVRYYLGGE